MSAVFLPIHVWDREFDSRVLIASILAGLGKTVFLGHEYNMAPLYGKSLNQFIFRAGRAAGNYRGKWDASITCKGGLAITQDEEGINKVPLLFSSDSVPKASVDYSAAQRFRNYANLEQASWTSHQLSWGSAHADFISSTYSDPEVRQFVSNNQIIDSTSVRFDALSDVGSSINKEQITSLNCIFGSFVLVLDNFTIDQGKEGARLHNPYRDLRNSGVPRHECLAELIRLQSERNREIDARKSFLEVLKQLSQAFPSTQFIFRPHPVHPREYWMRNLSSLKNFTVLSKGGAHPWLYSAACTIHSGCTTGLEASASNTPSIDISNLIAERPKYVQSSIPFFSKNKPTSFSELKGLINENLKSTTVTGQSNLSQKPSRHQSFPVYSDDLAESSILLFNKTAKNVQSSICNSLNLVNTHELIGSSSSIAKLIELSLSLPSTQSTFSLLDTLSSLASQQEVNLDKSISLSLTDFNARFHGILKGLSSLNLSVPALSSSVIAKNLFVIYPR